MKEAPVAENGGVFGSEEASISGIRLRAKVEDHPGSDGFELSAVRSH
jgi:hypothetical protein